MNRGSLKTRFISEVDGDDSENLQKNCYVAILFFFAHPGKVDNINTEYSPLKSNTIIIEVGESKITSGEK